MGLLKSFGGVAEVARGLVKGSKKFSNEQCTTALGLCPLIVSYVLSENLTGACPAGRSWIVAHHRDVHVNSTPLLHAALSAPSLGVIAICDSNRERFENPCH